MALPEPSPRRLHAVLLGALLLASATAVEAQDAPQGNRCGELRTHYGPFDYRKVRGEALDIVERHHFTPGVASLTKPGTTTFREMAGDVGYTLHAFPNHHRALIAMTRLGERHNTDTPPGARFSVECYFDRALRLAPDDTVARALFAQYLAKNKRKDDALRQLDVAVEKAEDNPLSHYNLGLLYFELGAYERALAQAHKAKALGFPRVELAEQLKRANQWREAPG